MASSFHHIPRLYIDSAIQAEQSVNASLEQSHYLRNVMRLKAGDELRLFNGHDGEWRGRIAGDGTGKKAKNAIQIALIEQLKPQNTEPDLWLCCAPIKKAHFDYMIEKATELGVSVIQPVLTRRGQVRDVNSDRCRAIAIEAAEQSERLSIPEIKEISSLKELAEKWPEDRTLIVCAEWGEAIPANEAFEKLHKTRAAIVVGPEGGFAEEELTLLRKVKNAVFIRLGPRILRADTAAIAALSLWQGACGDWSV